MVVWDQVESFLEDQEEEEIDISVVLDRLEALYFNPMNINEASYDELQESRLLSEIQINDLVYHKATYGDLILMEELQSIPSFTVADITRIRSFMEVSDEQKLPIGFGQMVQSTRHELYLKWAQTLEDKLGYLSREDTPPAYLGDKNKLQLRYKGSYENKLRFGLIAEKDEGEQLLSDTLYKGIDYLTAHLYMRDFSTLLKDVAIGDYSVSLGQGLIMHNGFGAGKSAWVTDIKKGGRTLRPYTSVNENGYQRGVAATLRPIKHAEVTLFGSRVARDGNLRLDTLDDETPEVFLSSLQTSGAHRTLAEKEDKGILEMTSFGGAVKYAKSNYTIGVNHLTSVLDKELIRSDQAYNRFRFSGNQLSNTSIDYSLRLKNIHLFGESAHSSSGGLAHIVGALVGLDKKASLAVLYRDYDTDYNALTPNAFAESNIINNEKGLYLGLELLLTRRWKLRTYADVWKHPWLRARVSNPSDGKEYLVRLDYYIKRKLSIYGQFFFEEKLQNASLSDAVIEQRGGDNKLTVGRTQRRYKFRLHFANKVSQALELRSRMEITTFENINGISKGYMLFQDFIYKPWASPLSLTARVAMFDTDDGNSRIYAYENNILYEFGIPTYSGRGVRYYFNIRYDLTRQLTAEFRLARTKKDMGTNGSGLELINGNTRTDLKAQLRYIF